MKSKKLTLTTLIISSISAITTTDSYSQRRERAVKNVSIKSTSKKNSVGLITPNTTIICKNPGDPNCIGPNDNAPIPPFACPTGQKKDANNNCVCEDSNLIVNPENKTQCIAKTSDNIVAIKKECGNVLIKAVQAQCENSYTHNGYGGYNDSEYKCYDPNELFALFDTSNLNLYVNGKAYKYDEVCYTYTEDLLTSIAKDYEITGANSIACKKARAIANASSECFALVLATGKATGATNAIKGDLQKTCGVAGLNQQYEKLYGTSAPSGIDFPTNIPDLYVSAGKIGVADGLELVGKLMDGKITDKTDTWERDITKINNSYLNQVSIHCGNTYTASLHNEDIQLLDEKSSLQRSIDENGAIKGSQVWALNQASVIVGENTINKVKREGFFGTTEDSEIVYSDIPVYEISRFDNDNLSKTIKDNDPKSGRYLFITNDEYRIIDIENNTNDYKYTTINYDDTLTLSNESLKAMLNKKENTTFSRTNETISK